MTMTESVATDTDSPMVPSRGWTAALVALALGLLLFIFYDGLAFMVMRWDSDEYSHGYMIPLVAAFMFWQQSPRLFAEARRGSALSVGVLLFGLFLFLLGELSAIYTLIQYGFLVAVYALVLALWGLRGAAVVSASLVYLLFMIPLPNFLYNNLSSELQLISSELGVAFLRLVGVSVYLEGNVIDLGAYKLQVVEACSGLRYLFPLTSFSFLVAYLYRGPVWIKGLVFLSAAPITILMNSFRIAVIGITVDNWGTELAEGFLHAFEGWFIFIACVAILFLEIWALNYLVSRSWNLTACFDLELSHAHRSSSVFTGPSSVPPSPSSTALGTSSIAPGTSTAALGAGRGWKTQRPLLLCLVILLLSAPWLTSIGARVEAEPQRLRFSSFPLLHNDWLGREGRIEAAVLKSLALADYLMADYRHPDYSPPVNLYVAYYGSQRKGASVHSPSSCIPGGGWEIESIETVDLAAASGAPPADPLPKANRVLIRKGNVRQLVYYWFQQRGRVITNEYLAKWYIFQDAMTKNRTDGALVRFVVPVSEGMSVAKADQQLVRFISDFQPTLRRYIPE